MLLVTVLFTACSTQPARDDVFLPDTPEPAAQPAGDASATPEPAAADVSPSDGPIDLGFEGGYGTVSVDEAQPATSGRTFGKPAGASQDWSCSVAPDCEGLPRPKLPGQWRCVQQQCVFVERTVDVVPLE